MLRTRCPHCNKLLGLDETKPVRVIVCPVCKEKFPFPKGETAPAAPTATRTPAKPAAPAKKAELSDYEVVEDDEPPARKLAARKVETDDYEVVDGVPVSPKPTKSSGNQPRPASARKTTPQDELPEVLPADEEEEDPPTPRPRKNRKKPRTRVRSSQSSSSFWELFSVNGGVVGGVLSMVLAVVWLIAGLAADRLYPYALVLFVIGLISFSKGVAGR
jgi:phage FluMu protein Com